MQTHADKNQENKDKAVVNTVSQKKSDRKPVFQFVDNRPEAIAQRKLQEMVNNHATIQQRIPKKENNTGLPDNLKTGIEKLSGYSMDDVKVHYNSDKPAQLQAHAYAQGAEIHLASGQEKHLPHEAWHVTQQKQGRVKPTTQLKGNTNINDDPALEKEADVMGSKAMQMESAGNPSTINSNVGASNETAQLKVGVEWETGIEAAKDWGAPYNEPPVSIFGGSAGDWDKDKINHAFLQKRYDQDERIWNSGSGWVIDSDNSKLEFVTEPPVNLKALLPILQDIQTEANKFPSAITPLYPTRLDSFKIKGSGNPMPLIKPYNAQQKFLGKITGKPQITVGIKFSKLFDFLKFLDTYELKSSKHLNALHKQEIEKRHPFSLDEPAVYSIPSDSLGKSAAPKDSSTQTEETPPIVSIFKDEAAANKGVMSSQKLAALKQLLQETEFYFQRLQSGGKLKSAKVNEVKALFAMTNHYYTVAKDKTEATGYKKMSFPLLLRSSFRSMFQGLDKTAQDDYKLAMAPAIAKSGEQKLFDGLTGEMSFKQWYDSIVDDRAKQVQVQEMPEATPTADYSNVFMESDLMTAPGAFLPRGHTTDKSMGALGKMEKDGDGDDLVVIELRDIAVFLNKSLGSYTPDVLDSFHKDLSDFALGGFIKDE